MPVDPDKRALRKMKKVLKRAGNKHRRADLKRHLAKDPNSADEHEENLGRYRSDSLNGIDEDKTRIRDKTFDGDTE